MGLALAATEVRRENAVRGCSAESTEAVTALAVQQITVRHRPAWDRYVRRHGQGTFFHTIAWMESVREAFGHHPHYLIAMRGEEVVGVLPLFRVESLLAGTMLVSVPYAVAGGILADSPEARDALWTAAREYILQEKIPSVELRSETRLLDDLASVDDYVGFRRRLPSRSDEVPQWLPRKARAAARNARMKHGLVCDGGGVYLRAVWSLYCRSMRRLGSLCYPYRFFEALCERSGADAQVLVTWHRRRIIGGLLSFRFNDTFLPYFVGCDERFNHCNTNNFLYQSAMQRAVDVGCTIFDFGRTRRDNRGSLDFKRFHGFEPRSLGYQRYVAVAGRAAELTPSNPRFRLARRVWKQLPPAACVTLGTWLSRHIPG